MRTPKAIRTDITQLEARRDALVGDLDSTQKTLDAAREGLIEGTNPVDVVTGAQSTYTALQQALNAVHERLENLGNELQLSLEEEQRKADETRLAVLDKEIAEQIDLYGIARREGSTALQTAVDKMLAVSDRLTELRREAGKLRPESTHQRMRPLQQDEQLPFGMEVNQAFERVINQRVNEHRKDAAREASRRQTERENEQRRRAGLPAINVPVEALEVV